MKTSNTYVQMALLTFLIASLIYLFLFVVFKALNIPFPAFLHITVSVLSAGYLVYRFLGARLG